MTDETTNKRRELLLQQQELLQKRANLLRNKNPSVSAAIETNKNNGAGRFGSFGLGLLQGAENFAKGQFEGSGEMEVPVPDMFKPEKIRGERQVNSPSFDFKQYINPEHETAFTVGEYAPLIAGAGIGGYKGLKGITNTGVAKQIINRANELQERYKGRFGNFFNEVNHELENVAPSKKSRKISGVEEYTGIPSSSKKKEIGPGIDVIGQKNYEKFKTASDADINTPIENAIKNPNIENWHWAKSSLRAWEREMRRLKISRGLTPNENSALERAQKMGKRITEHMNEEFDKLNPKFKEHYAELLRGYRKDYAPYLGNRSIRKARLKPGEEGYIAPHRLPSKLNKESGDPFRHGLGDEHQEEAILRNLRVNRALASPIVKYGLPIAGLEKLLSSIGS